MTLEMENLEDVIKEMMSLIAPKTSRDAIGFIFERDMVKIWRVLTESLDTTGLTKDEKELMVFYMPRSEMKKCLKNIYEIKNKKIQDFKFK